MPGARLIFEDGSGMTVRDFLKEDRPPSDFEGATILMPMAKEDKWGEAATPNAPTEGNIHDPTRERFIAEIPLHELNADKLGDFKLALQRSVEAADRIKRYQKFLRYADEEYD